MTHPPIISGLEVWAVGADGTQFAENLFMADTPDSAIIDRWQDAIEAWIDTSEDSPADHAMDTSRLRDSMALALKTFRASDGVAGTTVTLSYQGEPLDLCTRRAVLHLPTAQGGYAFPPATQHRGDTPSPQHRGDTPPEGTA